MRGAKDKYNLNFGPTVCDVPNKYTATTDQSYTVNRTITALPTNYVGVSGTGVVVFDEVNKYYDIIYLTETTAISSLSGYGLREPMVVNDGFNGFKLYTYNSDTHGDAYVNNLIDWDNPRNTLDFTLSSATDWYGEYGIVEQIIDYNLHKGLGFLED